MSPNQRYMRLGSRVLLTVSPMQIYIAKNGSPTGPFTEEQARGMISAGMISHDDLAFTYGTADWRPLRAILHVSQTPPIPSPSVSAPPASTISTPSDGPRGVGGWLTFFCAGLIICSPFYALGTMFAGWEEAQPAFDRFPTLKSAVIWETFWMSALVI